MGELKSKRCGLLKYAQRYMERNYGEVDPYYFEDGRFGAIKPETAVEQFSAEQERLFIGGCLEGLHWRFEDKYVIVACRKALKSIIAQYAALFGEEVDQTRYRINLSWELFATWVHFCIQDRELERKYRTLIYRHYNIQRFMAAAQRIAKKSRCQKRKVGAILVVNGKIIKRAWNFHPPKTRLDNTCIRLNIKSGCDNDNCYGCHAEQALVALSAPKYLRNGIVFINCPPCRSCTRVLMQSGAKLVVFKQLRDYPNYGPEMAWQLAGRTKFYGV